MLMVGPVDGFGAAVKGPPWYHADCANPFGTRRASTAVRWRSDGLPVWLAKHDQGCAGCGSAIVRGVSEIVREPRHGGYLHDGCCPPQPRRAVRSQAARQVTRRRARRPEPVVEAAPEMCSDAWWAARGVDMARLTADPGS
jgi:hypothetical protein